MSLDIPVIPISFSPNKNDQQQFSLSFLFIVYFDHINNIQTLPFQHYAYVFIIFILDNMKTIGFRIKAQLPSLATITKGDGTESNSIVTHIHQQILL